MNAILLVEDEPRVSAFIARGLAAEGYRVIVAGTGQEALALAKAQAFTAIILDLMLPGMDGREVCRRLRLGGDSTPVLMLTALDALEDKVEGLRLGADDYLTKPFAFEELVARIAALIRRRANFASTTSRLVVGDLVFDRDSLTVTRAGRRIDLTAKELALLEMLMAAPGRVFGRARILARIWGLSEDPLTNVVDVYIRRLRRKLDGDAPTSLITTVRGFGYRLNPSPVKTACDDRAMVGDWARRDLQ